MVNNPLTISFLVTTKVTKVDDLSGRIPRYALQFIDLDTLD